MKASSSPAARRHTARLLAFLRDPKSFPGRPPRVHLIQTHASCLALAGR